MFGIVPSFGNMPSPVHRDSVRDFDALFPFAHDFGKELSSVGFSMSPVDISINVEDCDDKYVVDAMVPGVDRENIDVTFDDDILSIEIKQEDSKEETKRNIVYRESTAMKRVRKIRFTNVDGSNISAALADGVLKVTLPKVEVDDSKVHVEIG